MKVRLGFTLSEVLVSILISTIIIAFIITFLRLGIGSYQGASAYVIESKNARVALDILHNDLKRISSDLPLSIMNGNENRGGDFIKGYVFQWPVHLSDGELLPDQRSMFPSDRIGFFIKLSDGCSSQYGGKNIAHVLYFTAFTSDLHVEEISRQSLIDQDAFTPKLYRHFTPPDRVYERLTLIPQKGGHAVPRGENDAISELLTQKESFGVPVTSLVAANVVQFKVNFSATLEAEIMSQDPKYASEYTQISRFFQKNTGEEVPSLHDVLSASTVSHYPRISLSKVQFQLGLCPTNKVPTLTRRDWRRRVDGSGNSSAEGIYLARENIKPLISQLTVSLPHAF